MLTESGAATKAVRARPKPEASSTARRPCLRDSCNSLTIAASKGLSGVATGVGSVRRRLGGERSVGG